MCNSAARAYYSLYLKHKSYNIISAIRMHFVATYIFLFFPTLALKSFTSHEVKRDQRLEQLRTTWRRKWLRKNSSLPSYSSSSVVFIGSLQTKCITVIYWTEVWTHWDIRFYIIYWVLKIIIIKPQILFTSWASFRKVMTALIKDCVPGRLNRFFLSSIQYFMPYLDLIFSSEYFLLIKSTFYICHFFTMYSSSLPMWISK